MKISNQNKKTILAINAKKVTAIIDQLLGLLNPDNPRSLIFNTRFGIHTFGMRIPIDIIVLDSNNYVVKLQSDLTPNRLFFWNPKHSIVIELPAGTIHKSKTQLGDLLLFDE